MMAQVIMVMAGNCGRVLKADMVRMLVRGRGWRATTVPMAA